MQKKETIFQKAKRKWQELDEGVKIALISSGSAAFLSSLITSAIDGKMEKKRADQWKAAMDDESKFMYQIGLKDGQTRAYYTLLTKPDEAFQKMGMKPMHF